MISGDIGVVIQLIVKDTAGAAVNISAASTKDFLFINPTGTAVTKGATFVTDGTDGKLKYTTVSGDFPDSGTWKIRVSLVTPSWSRKSNWSSFIVNS